MNRKSKLDIATELLDRALRLYYDGDSYFAALHLAGASEEILAVYLKRQGGISAFDGLKDLTVWLSMRSDNRSKEKIESDIFNLMNHAKNSTKHMYGKNDCIVDFNAESEAHDILDRAVSNCYQLMFSLDLKETELTRRFTTEMTQA